MKVFVSTVLASSFITSNAKILEPKRVLQDEECVAECQTPLIEALEEIFEGLEEAQKTEITTDIGEDFSAVSATDVFNAFSDTLEEGVLCLEGVNENLHRLVSCEKACEGIESCDDLEANARQEFEESLNDVECDSEDGIGECEGLDIAFEEINSSVQQGLGLFAMLTAVFGAVVTHQ
eukprot:snap_masked-scaffold_10-processed-gene-4.37-mRNA-1 protein AED:1.00 eAED:1.00 QI:0/-1/0/0/-1/1/1/0/177